MAGIGEASAILTVAVAGFSLTSKLKHLFDDYKNADATIEKLREELEATSKSLQNLGQLAAYDDALFDLTLDQKEIEKRMTQLAEVRTDMLTAQARFFIELRQFLTPEQFAKLRQLMEDERQKNIQQRLLNQ